MCASANHKQIDAGLRETAAERCPTIINADLIAAALSPFRPEIAAVRAGWLMLELMADGVRRGESSPLNHAQRTRLRAIDPGVAARGLCKAVKAILDVRPKPAEPQRMDAFYDPARKCYWIPNDRGEMIEITETSLVRHLVNAGFVSDRNQDGTPVAGRGRISYWTSTTPASICGRWARRCIPRTRRSAGPGWRRSGIACATGRRRRGLRRSPRCPAAGERWGKASGANSTTLPAMPVG